MVQFVMGQLPQNEIIEGAIRREQKLVPEIVMRELIANALIHQDCAITGASVMVEIYTDRIEISDPGKPRCREIDSLTVTNLGMNGWQT